MKVIRAKTHAGVFWKDLIIVVDHLGTLTKTTNISSLGFHGFNLFSISSSDWNVEKADRHFRGAANIWVSVYQCLLRKEEDGHRELRQSLLNIRNMKLDHCVAREIKVG